MSVVALRQASRPLVDVAASMARVAGGDLTTRLRAISGELGHARGLVQHDGERGGALPRRAEADRGAPARGADRHRIQTANPPGDPAVKGFEVAARMKPADDVGGDLYDVLAFDDTFWLVVGDVSGHGVKSGLVMMMAQAAAYGAIAAARTAVRAPCSAR